MLLAYLRNEVSKMAKALPEPWPICIQESDIRPQAPSMPLPIADLGIPPLLGAVAGPVSPSTSSRFDTMNQMGCDTSPSAWQSDTEEGSHAGQKALWSRVSRLSGSSGV